MTDGCGLKGDPIESPETLESINEKFNKIFRKKCVCNEGHFLPFRTQTCKFESTYLL